MPGGGTCHWPALREDPLQSGHLLMMPSVSHHVCRLPHVCPCFSSKCTRLEELALQIQSNVFVKLHGEYMLGESGLDGTGGLCRATGCRYKNLLLKQAVPEPFTDFGLEGAHCFNPKRESIIESPNVLSWKVPIKIIESNFRQN